jgi:hypothetical protein
MSIPLSNKDSPQSLSQYHFPDNFSVKAQGHDYDISNIEVDLSQILKNTALW